MESKRHIIKPMEGGIVDKISPLLKCEKPFLGPDSFNELNLILQNNTDERFEGLLEITPPYGWILEPGNSLIIAIRPQKFVMAEFYLSVPTESLETSHLLEMQITLKGDMVSRAIFDLGPALLYVVNS